MPVKLSDDDARLVVSIAKRQIALMDKLEAALLAGDDAQALTIARQLVGLEKQLSAA